MRTTSIVDTPQVERWLVEHVPPLSPPLSYGRIGGGRSNLTFLVTDASGRRVVLRRPPDVKTPAGAHNVLREQRIVSAMASSSVPVPRVLGACDDPETHETPFFVMDYVEGEVLDSSEKAAKLAVPLRERAAFDLIEIMARLHLTDVDAIGLGDLSRRDSFFERQLRRLDQAWQASKTRDLPEMEEVAGLLAAHVPQPQATSIFHGDFRLGNCLVDQETGKINALLDWELCTLGDPLADVGLLRPWWTDPGDSKLLPNDSTAVGGFPTFDALVERYAQLTGFDLSGLSFYIAYAWWRLAVIIEGVYSRALAGALGEDVDLDELRDQTPHRARLALEAASALR